MTECYSFLILVNIKNNYNNIVMTERNAHLTSHLLYTQLLIAAAGPVNIYL